MTALNNLMSERANFDISVRYCLLRLRSFLSNCFPDISFILAYSLRKKMVTHLKDVRSSKSSRPFLGIVKQPAISTIIKDGV